jgi:sporulation protein YqfD
MEDAAPIGAGAWLRRLLRRPGLLAGGALACALLVFAMQFVWLVRIEGAGPYRADIAAYLHEEGYRPGIRREGVDARQLALLLQRRYPQVVWFRVYVNNVTLTVECTQGIPAPSLPAREPCDLVAARDGVVQAVEVYAGTAAVRPGELVRRGQVLIRGQEAGADGAVLPAAARGRVLARCWQKTEVRIPLQETVSRETGRSSRCVQLCTPWLCWPGAAEAPAFLTSQLYQTDTPLVGCFFPVWQRVSEYREVELTYALRPEAEVRTEAEQAAAAQLHRGLRGYPIIREWLETRVGEDGYVYAAANGEYLADLCLGENGEPSQAPPL